MAANHSQNSNSNGHLQNNSVWGPPLQQLPQQPGHQIQPYQYRVPHLQIGSIPPPLHLQPPYPFHHPFHISNFYFQCVPPGLDVFFNQQQTRSSFRLNYSPQTPTPPSRSTPISPVYSISTPRYTRTDFTFTEDESDLLFYLYLHDGLPEHMTSALNRFRAPKKGYLASLWTKHIQEHIQARRRGIRESHLMQCEAEIMAARIVSKAGKYLWNKEVVRAQEAAVNNSPRRLESARDRAKGAKARSAYLRWLEGHNGVDPVGGKNCEQGERLAIVGMELVNAGAANAGGEDSVMDVPAMVKALLKIVNSAEH